MKRTIPATLAVAFLFVSAGMAAESMLTGHHPDKPMDVRHTTFYLGDKVQDRWKDNPDLPADPQRTIVAQSFTLDKPATVDRIEFFFYRTAEAPEEGIDLRIETDDAGKPFGFIVDAAAKASVPPTKGATEYQNFVFDTPVKLDPGTYWIVLEKKPNADPSKHLFYPFALGDIDRATKTRSDGYAGGHAAIKESQGGEEGNWRVLPKADAFFGVYGRWR